MQTQLPALLIVVPMLSAAIIAFIPHRVAARVFAVAITWGCFAVACNLALTAAIEPISYQMGGWAPPIW